MKKKTAKNKKAKIHKKKTAKNKKNSSGVF